MKYIRKILSMYDKKNIINEFQFHKFKREIFI